jgi:hypothetical protein
MTVFLIDARYTTRMTELRSGLFGDNFPASRCHHSERVCHAGNYGTSPVRRGPRLKHDAPF